MTSVPVRHLQISKSDHFNTSFIRQLQWQQSQRFIFQDLELYLLVFSEKMFRVRKRQCFAVDTMLTGF